MIASTQAATLSKSIQELAAHHRISSLSVNVRVDGREVFHLSHGLARRSPPRPALDDQPYDLASLTKALAGSIVTASMIDEGLLRDETPVSALLPEVDPRITLRHLLDHSSGLPKWNNFYEGARTAWGVASTRAGILTRACQTPIQAPPGTRHVYTDIGFLVLLRLLEHVGGEPFDRLFAQRVLKPAGLTDLRWGWPMAAATEACPVRGTLIEGTVHDLNCAALGGISTHAGLFAPARAVSALAQALLDAALHPPSHPALPGSVLGRWWRERGPGSHTGGWDTVSRGSYTSTGHHVPDDAVGHLGYTGTSVWIVPSKRTILTLLTNRIHPRDELAGIRAARPAIHDAIAQTLGWPRVG